ncbi:MAG: hypothetical protein GY765_04095, partial [bacterium]|nr:hypothetical protein [bacterium]
MINLGKISKTRGIKGEVLHTSPGEGVYALGKGETLLLKSEKYEKQFIVEYSKNIRGGAVLKLQGVDSISSAFKLVGYAIHIDRPA